ncbi:MAG: helix-turn-helix transcriptional regulator [Oscillospiraceae bacterium]|jgi:ArsR family transcriptional regulator|nr:helix-turn-helix transcriptional regulator [Oscillospiraceae bacterium]
MGTHQENARVFKALCDPKRLAILEQLRSGEKCACVLQEPMDLTQSGLSYHMKILCDSGLVASRQEGKWTHYRLSESGRNEAVKLLLAITTPDADQECGCRSCDRETPS